jgi:glucokinase
LRQWLAIDIGGTKVAAAMVGDDGRVGAKCTEATQGANNIEMAEQLRGVVRHVCKDSALEPAGLAGVGVAVPGSVDRASGTAVGAVNLGFRRLPIAAVVGQITPAPVAVENDTNAGALGEKWFGAGRSVDHFAYVAVGTGVGGGLVLGGRLYSGARGAAGEVGHCIVDPSGLQCRCGSIGCLEGMASGVGLPRLAVKVLGEQAARALGGGHLPDPLAVYGAAAQGDEGARRVVAEAGRLLAVAVVNLFRLLDVERVIIGGGVAAAGQPFLEAVWGGVTALGMRRLPPEAVVLSPLGSNANLLGAAAVVRERVGGGGAAGLP